MTSPVTCRCGAAWPPGATACPRCGSAADATLSLDHPSGSSGNTVTAGATGAVAPAAPPEVPGYEVLGELGRGGMGVVYRAREVSLNRVVALKVLLSGAHAGERDLARFRAEAEAAAAVQHPNVVPVFAVGQHGGLPYLAMELVPGGSLAARLERGPLPPAEAARVVEAVARGVTAAHIEGILHRDLKPANILFDDHGDPKVADFGLAKIGDAGLTASGAVMGTPAYMSPEQARGDTRRVGVATDVWAVGAILYECLAGRPPFRGRSAPETFRLVCEADPDPLPRGVPRDLATVALKCLEKDPAKRYRMASYAADDLARFLAGAPISARRAGPLARAARWVRRHPGPVYMAAGALLAAAMVYAVYPRPEPDPLPEIGQQPPAPPAEPEEPRPPRKGAVGKVQAAADRMKSQNNLKELAIAAHNMYQTFGRFPADAIYDPKTGRPLLSWRVAYLPYLKEQALYKQFKLTEPWDSPHNLALLDRMPAVFAMPETDPPKGHTHYQVFTGPGTLFDPALLRADRTFGKIGPGITDFPDGTTNTVMFAEAAAPVPWTKPADLVVAPDRPLPARGGVFEGGYNVGTVDGRVYFVSDRVSEKTWREMLTPKGGEVPAADWPDGPKK